jgi:hypothetical protein
MELIHLLKASAPVAKQVRGHEDVPIVKKCGIAAKRVRNGTGLITKKIVRKQHSI